MARKATAGSSKAGSGKGGNTKKSGGASRRAVAVAPVQPADDNEDERSNAADAFLKILQSPIVADLLAVAAMAALTALAEHGFSSRGAGNGRRTGRAVKAAGKAAAAAIGRRLATEVEEIRSAAKAKRGEAA